MLRYYKVLMFSIFLNLLVSCTKSPDELDRSFLFNYQTAFNNGQLNGTCEKDMMIDLINLLGESCNINHTEQECENQYSQFKNNFPNLNCSVTEAPREVVRIFGTQVTNLTQSHTIDITEEYINELLYNDQGGECGAIPRMHLKDVIDSFSKVELPETELQERTNKEYEAQYENFKIKYPDLNCFIIFEESIGYSNTEVVEEKILFTLDKFDRLFYNSQGNQCGKFFISDWFLTFKSCLQAKWPTTKLKERTNETCKSNISGLKEKYPNMRCFISIPIGDDIYDISPKEIIKSIENELISIEGLDV